MSRNATFLFAVAFALVLVSLWRWPRGGEAAPELALGEEPTQWELADAEDVPIERDGVAYTLVKTHRYRVVGEVLSSATYRVFFANDLYDVDLALAWGPEVEELKARFSFRQDARWLFWQSDTPVSDEERRWVTTHTGNQHLIPAEGRAELDKAIRWAEEGDLVAIEGWLVQIRGPDSRTLARSSTRRDDSGNGACEIVLVESFQNGGTVWR